uniref:Uncharacterized protein n=1 Tax=Anguilla anguilla TaxID=7936 RepID=A0A0E9VUB6_ANGAN
MTRSLYIGYTNTM